MVRPESRPVSGSLIVPVSLLALCLCLVLLDSLPLGLTDTGQFSLAHYIHTHTTPARQHIVLNSVIFVLGASLLATLLALWLAFLRLRTDVPGQWLITVMAIFPILIPPVLIPVTWALLLNPADGLLNQALQYLFGLESPPLDIHSRWSMLLVGGLLNVPVAYLIIAPAMAALDPALETAARVSGSGPVRALLRCTLPLLRPALLTALILGIARSLASYAVPRVLDTPGQIAHLPSYRHDGMWTALAADASQAAGIGMSLLSTLITLVVLYRALTAASTRHVLATTRRWHTGRRALGALRHPLGLMIGLLCLLMVGLPVLALLYASLTPDTMRPGPMPLAAMDLTHWRTLLQAPDAGAALRNSLCLAIAGATLGTVLCLGVGGLVTHLPGCSWLRIKTFAQIHHPQVEMSRICGAGRLTTLRRILMPLRIPGMAVAWCLMTALFLCELPLSAALMGPDIPILASQILDNAHRGLQGPLSALGLTVIALCAMLALCALAAARTARQQPGPST